MSYIEININCIVEEEMNDIEMIKEELIEYMRNKGVIRWNIETY